MNVFLTEGNTANRSTAMIILTPMQARVLGCLMEKKETTPDQYPLTLNALRNACNQKSSRSPVVNYSEGEVGHTIRELEAMDLVREEWGARVPKYEHSANKVLGLHSQGIALTCVMILRGPQTLNELKTNSHRMFAFDDLDDVQFAVKQLIEHEPPLAIALPRQTGQKEGRYAHLLCGEPDIPAPTRPPVSASSSNSLAGHTTGHSTSPSTGLTARVEELEKQLEELNKRLKALEDGSPPSGD